MTFLEIPTGKLDNPTIKFNMAKIYEAEKRLPEIRTLNSSVAVDLKCQFLEAHADALKYLSILKYQYLLAKRQFDIATATALLDKYPDYAKNLKESGMKDNEDIRKCFLNRDADVLKWREVLDAVNATTVYMENKEKVMDRAYWECKSSLETHGKLMGNQPFSQGTIENSTPMMPIGISRT